MKKRSRYRPTPIRFDVMAFVQAGMRPLAATGQLSTLQIKNHDALASLALGCATRTDMDKLVAAVNMAESLAWLGFGKNWSAGIKAGEDAVKAVSERGAAASHWVATGLELAALRELMNIHDAQLEIATVQQIEKAMDHIKEVERNKRARKIAA